MKANDYRNKLTEETLEALGFKNCGKDKWGNKNVYRIQPIYYAFQIQVILGDYPASNPNCGVLGIYTPEEEVKLYTTKGKLKKIKLKEEYQPIAWYVNTPERLQSIIISLTHINL